MKAGYLLTTATALGFAVFGSAAHATLTYTIWTGDFGGSNFHSAQPPVPTTHHLVTFTHSGNPINFVNNGAGALPTAPTIPSPTSSRRRSWRSVMPPILLVAAPL